MTTDEKQTAKDAYDKAYTEWAATDVAYEKALAERTTAHARLVAAEGVYYAVNSKPDKAG